MKESAILHASLLALSDAGHLSFRNNTAVGWAGKSVCASKPVTITLMPGDVVVRNAYPIHAGLCKGSGDIVGLRPDGRFFSIECKTAIGRQRPEQVTFGNAIINHGGIYGVARSAREAVDCVGQRSHGGKV